jgi:tetratricopeptide (TPR) repeat protein
MWKPGYQQLCLLLNALIIFCICIYPILSETHWILSDDGDENSGKIVSVTGSPLCLKQPHSLIDFIEQHKIVQSMRELQSQLKTHEKQAFALAKINESEHVKQFRKENEDCQKSEKLAFSDETFSQFFNFDLMPFFTDRKDFSYPPKVKDVMNPQSLKTLYFGPLKRKRGAEPICSSIFVSEAEDTVIKIADTFPGDNYQPEKELIDLKDKDLTHLAEILSAALDDEDYKFFGLYYAGFYWRYLGNPREAATCLQKHLIMSISTAGIYQIGCIHARAKDYYHAIAAFRTSDETLTNGYSSQWFHAGGDVHVLTQLYQEANNYYKKAFKIALDKSEKDLLEKKQALIRCELGVMELQNIRPDSDITDLKVNLNSWELKQSQMFQRMIPIEKWFKEKYAYEFLTGGPVDGMQCKGTKTPTKKHYVSCKIENPRKYETAMLARRQLKRLEESQKAPELLEEISKAPQQHAAYLNYMLEAHIAFHNYFQKLEPYVSIIIDEPQHEKKYPLKISNVRSPRLDFIPEDCDEMLKFNKSKLFEANAENYEDFPAFPQMFIPPDNKGYLTSYILTTLLALTPSEISPLPWSEPECGPFLDEPITEEDSMEIFPNLTVSDFTKVETSIFQEPSLKKYLTSILDKKSKALIGDIGQRISTIMRYTIGPKWISGNLATIYWRYYGKPKEAAICLKFALSDAIHEDLALAQLAQLTMKLGPNYLVQSKQMIQKALEIDSTEPISHYILGYLHFLTGSFYNAKQEFLKALIFEPNFKDAKMGLTRISCLQKSWNFNTVKINFNPICCWPAEQNAYCYGKGKSQKCYRLALKENNQGTVNNLELEYVRCSGKYTRKSYSAPPALRILAPYFISRQDIQDIIIQKKVNSIPLVKETTDLPVIPLDYGGYDPENFEIYKQNLPNMSNFEQDMTDFGEVREIRLRQEREAEQLKKAKMTDKEFEEKVLMIEGMTDRKQMMVLDVELPSYLPEPAEDLIKKGLRYLNPPKENTLADYCVMTEKNKRVLDHPSPTYISVTAKGVKLEDYVDPSSPVTAITRDEPFCPDVEATDEWKMLDELPAFRFQEFFKFYKPELALSEALMSLGNKHEKIEHVAARLHLAMKTSKLNPKHGRKYFAFLTKFGNKN